MTTARYPVLTIGHSNHEPQAFVSLLRTHGVDAVVDVRSAPYSRYLPHFNKEHLERILREGGIRYAFKGKELGGQPANRACYDADGRILYDKLAETDAFKEGVAYVLEAAAAQPAAGSESAAVHPSTSSGRTAAGRGAGRTVAEGEAGRTAAGREAGRTVAEREAGRTGAGRDGGRTAAEGDAGRMAADGDAGRTAAAPAGGLALMCSEKEPLECHRTLLISRTLAGRGVAVAHVHADGSLESHEDAMNRLLDLFKLPHHGDLFRPREAVIDDAAARQARRVGARWRADPAY